MAEGTVFRIQKYSIHDGPGIRTAVFLKGCPLDCWWCHNPEGRRFEAEIVYHESRCIHCGRCVKPCTRDAVRLDGGRVILDKIRCMADSVKPACVQACPARALEAVGREMTVDEVMDEILKDLVFYEESGGGVTFTGGEPLAQYGFLLELMQSCRREGIHTAVETSGYAAWERLRDISEWTDLILYDLKLMNDEKHQKYTGVSNRLILDNLARLAGIRGDVNIRIPLIPGINEDDENTESTCRLLNSMRINKVDLLPYHNTGIYKYEQLDLPYRLADTGCHSRQEIEAIAEKFRQFGISVSIGG